MDTDVLVTFLRDMKDIHLITNIPEEVLSLAYRQSSHHRDGNGNPNMFSDGLKSPRVQASILENSVVSSPKSRGASRNAAHVGLVGQDWGTPAGAT